MLKLQIHNPRKCCLATLLLVFYHQPANSLVCERKSDMQAYISVYVYFS